MTFFVLFNLIFTFSIIMFICIFVVSFIVIINNYRRGLNTIVSSIQDYEQEEITKPKNVVGMTKIMEESILKDFPDFNKDLLFNITETNLRKIFQAIKNKDTSELNADKSLSFIYQNVAKVIDDYRKNNIYEEYTDIFFHQHAIKDYRKSKGKATITVSTSLEYYYKTNRKNGKDYISYKKQTRYTTNFCYVYDEVLFDNNQVEFSVNCPNCGAPMKKMGSGKCEYCNSYVEMINLKAWKMISYKEDYK